MIKHHTVTVPLILHHFSFEGNQIKNSEAISFEFKISAVNSKFDNLITVNQNLEEDIIFLCTFLKITFAMATVVANNVNFYIMYSQKNFNLIFKNTYNKYIYTVAPKVLKSKLLNIFLS